MEMFRFAYPEYFWAFWLIPLLTLFFVMARLMRQRALRQFGNLTLIRELMPSVSTVRPVLKFGLLMLALSAFILGAARPQFGSKLQTVKREGVEIMILLDVSNSMMAEDIQPNRLERAKRAIDRLISRLRDDKIGLIVFAGEAYTQLPITSDYGSAQLFLASVSTDIVPRQGTAIGAAIELATRSFTPNAESSKAIIVITDGENHEDDAVGAAARAADNGIVVHTIGMGLPQGAPIPIVRGSSTDYLRDRENNVVITRLDEVMLEKISTTGNGVYIRASTANVGLEDLLEEINQMQKVEMEARLFSEYEDLFPWFFMVGLAILLLEFLIMDRKNSYLRKIRIFG